MLLIRCLVGASRMYGERRFTDEKHQQKTELYPKGTKTRGMSNRFTNQTNHTDTELLTKMHTSKHTSH